MKNSKQTLLEVSRDNILPQRILIVHDWCITVTYKYVIFINSKVYIDHKRNKLSYKENSNYKCVFYFHSTVNVIDCIVSDGTNICNDYRNILLKV